MRDKQLSHEQGLTRLRAFLTLPISYVPNDDLLDPAFDLATRFQFALYDALYVALADLLELPFVTADERTARLARQRRVPRVTWYEDALPTR